MDATYKYYMSFSKEEILSDIKQYVDIVKKYNGNFVSIFHNDNFGTENWQEIYVKMLKYISND